MRMAKINDHWRGVSKHNYLVKLKHLSYSGIPGLGNGEIDFISGINAICGPNGAGKSTLLRCIGCLLGTIAISALPEIKEKVLSGIIGADIFANDTDTQLSYDFSNSDIMPTIPDRLESFWLEPSREIPELINGFIHMKNRSEMLESVEAKNIEPKELELLAYVVGKEYTQVKIYEIESIFGRDIVPYFEVTSFGVTYKSENMGLGEYALFYMFWFLNRLEGPSILLIEEPESYIFPRSQENYMNYLASISVSKGIWCIVTTHAPQILKRIMPECVSLMMNTASGSMLIKSQKPVDYISALGEDPQKNGIVFVEDYASQEFFKMITSKYDNSFLKTFAITRAGSYSQVIGALKSIPSIGHWLKVLGVLDGDMRENNIEINSGWGLVFLPGNEAPDQLLVNIIKEYPDDIAKFLNKGKELVSLAIASLEGVNHHDYLCGFATHLNLQVDHIILAAFNVWINIPDNQSQAREFYDSVVSAISDNNI